MNGQPRNPHNGEDIGAPLGAAVAASNDGVVRLTVDHVFSGKGVFIDHGLGFYTVFPASAGMNRFMGECRGNNCCVPRERGSLGSLLDLTPRSS